MDKINFISTDTATEKAIKGAKIYNLVKDPNIASVLNNGEYKTPLLVKRLDKENNYYYLIPWILKNRIALVIELNALDGSLLGATYIPQKAQITFISPKKALKLAAKAYPNYKFKKSRLVWRPCQESYTPLQPFHQIPYKKGFLYISMDSKIYHHLTLGLKG